VLIEAEEPFVLHTTGRPDQASRVARFGLHAVALTAETPAGCESLAFTFYYPSRDSWEGRDFAVAPAPADSNSAGFRMSSPDGRAARG
jgi:hypothetical protein